MTGRGLCETLLHFWKGINSLEASRSSESGFFVSTDLIGVEQPHHSVWKQIYHATTFARLSVNLYLIKIISCFSGTTNDTGGKPYRTCKFLGVNP